MLIYTVIYSKTANELFIKFMNNQYVCLRIPARQALYVLGTLLGYIYECILRSVILKSS